MEIDQPNRPLPVLPWLAVHPRCPMRPSATLTLVLLGMSCTPAEEDTSSDCDTLLFADADGDGYGDLGTSTLGCEGDPGWTLHAGDCDDDDATVHPGVDDGCDGRDDDCDGVVDEDCVSTCGDGQLTGHETCEEDADDACPGQCSSWCRCPSLPPGDLELHVIDVGQGDSELVVSPDGFTLLVDAGNSDDDSTVLAYMDQHGIPALDLVLASHLHEDHLGGLPGVVQGHPEVAVCYDHGGRYSSSYTTTWRDAAGARLQVLGQGDTLDLGGSMTVEVLHGHERADNENLNSLVLKLSYGDTTMLLGGDCESDGCESDFDPGPIDVYKVHHHGSSDSSGTQLLGQMEPRLALIPVGRGNSYGHPDEGTLRRLDGAGAEVLRTDQDGDLRVWSDGVDIDWESGR